jgi:hypothetical protein
MNNVRKSQIVLGLTIAIWVLTLTLCTIAVVDAYGSGPPYFGRTTNMDKWTSPIPYLAVLVTSAVFLTFVSRWVGKRLS